MDKITLSLQTINQIMAYLGSKPYQETFQLINAIQDEAKSQTPTSSTAETVVAQ